MKLSTKQIALTGILLAISIVSQFMKNTSVFITGPIINACLILAVAFCGLVCGLILAVITPVTAFLITGSPIMAAIPMMIPMVMLGNAVLVISVQLFRNMILKHKTMQISLPVGVVCGSILKAVVMGITISLWLLPTYLPEKLLPKLAPLQMQFSMVQLVTALLGGVIAYILWIPLRKTLK